MYAFCMATAMSLVGPVLPPPPPNPPFNFDEALIRQVSPDVKWSRSDVDANGVMTGIVQNERRLCLGLIIEDVYPFGGPGSKGPPPPFRRINGISTVKKNHDKLYDIMSGRGK